MEPRSWLTAMNSCVQRQLYETVPDFLKGKGPHLALQKVRHCLIQLPDFLKGKGPHLA